MLFFSLVFLSSSFNNKFVIYFCLTSLLWTLGAYRGREMPNHKLCWSERHIETPQLRSLFSSKPNGGINPLPLWFCPSIWFSIGDPGKKKEVVWVQIPAVGPQFHTSLSLKLISTVNFQAFIIMPTIDSYGYIFRFFFFFVGPPQSLNSSVKTQHVRKKSCSPPSFVSIVVISSEDKH